MNAKVPNPISRATGQRELDMFILERSLASVRASSACSEAIYLRDPDDMV
jgi:hypothetical protein